jgi:hypothetical protein
MILDGFAFSERQILIGLAILGFELFVWGLVL